MSDGITARDSIDLEEGCQPVHDCGYLGVCLLRAVPLGSVVFIKVLDYIFPASTLQAAASGEEETDWFFSSVKSR